MTRTLVVVGHGMVGHRLIETLRSRDESGSWHVVVLGEEAHPAYDRVGLSSYLDGKTAADLSLVSQEFRTDPRVELRLNTGAASVDSRNRTVTSHFLNRLVAHRLDRQYGRPRQLLASASFM